MRAQATIWYDPPHFNANANANIPGGWRGTVETGDPHDSVVEGGYYGDTRKECIDTLKEQFGRDLEVFDL